jgi:starvation-inducible DNA-binding protein
MGGQRGRFSLLQYSACEAYAEYFIRNRSDLRGNARETSAAQSRDVHLPETETMNARESEHRRFAPALGTAGIEPHAVVKISADLTVILADLFALYVKTKNFHWHIAGPHFRDYHLLLDEQSEQIFATTDAIAERVRKIGGATLHSIGHIARLQRIADNDSDSVAAEDMLAELCEDNRLLTVNLRSAHALCDEHGDVASASLIEVWIDEAERRTWFLYEATRSGT